MSLTGGCLCGAVRYQLEGEPRMVFLCHCRDCQRSGGSLLHYGLAFPESAFTREGEVKAYTRKSDGGRAITREFCPTCGSGIDNKLELMPGFVVVKGGTLDEPAAAQLPTFELYTHSKASYLRTPDGMPGFARELTVHPKTLTWKPT